MNDPFDIQRFVTAQEAVYPRVIRELSAGEKLSHWMWFIFPQVAGLGTSEMAQRYAVKSEAEAVAYLAHEVLGPRLVECTRLVLAVKGRTINQILGSPDDMKFRSSMTLFAVACEHPIFDQALLVYCEGGRDQATLDILQAMDHARR